MGPYKNEQDHSIHAQVKEDLAKALTEEELLEQSCMVKIADTVAEVRSGQGGLHLGGGAMR